MTITRGNAVIYQHFVATPGWFGPSTEIEFDRFPSIARLSLQAEAGSRLVTAMRHAILASRIAGNPIDDSILLPIDIGQQFGVGTEMAGAIGAHRVGHEIARCFPAPHVASRNGPG